MAGYNSAQPLRDDEPAFEYHGLERWGGTPVRGITGCLRAGECVALLGTPRSGKHTLLAALANADLDAGVLVWNHERVTAAW